MNNRYLKISFLIIFNLLLSSCGDNGNDADSHIQPENIANMEWLQRNILEWNAQPRLQHGLLSTGFYQSRLNQDWTPKPTKNQQASLISQNRFIYVMAAAYEVTGDKNYREATRSATDYLLEYFAHPTLPGYWANKIHSDGTAGSRSFHAYGHAHTIFALSHAFLITQDNRYRDAALQTWLALDVSKAIAGKHEQYDLRGLNVSMHLFESLLVLYKVSHWHMVKVELQYLGDHIVDKFFDPSLGVFVEELTPMLNPLPDGEIRLGHAIEMAFLLSRAVDIGLPPAYLEPAGRAVNFVIQKAAADQYGLIHHTVGYDGTVRDPKYYWWSQTELLRGLAHFIWERDRKDLESQFERSLSFVRNNFIDQQFGGWFSTLDAKEKDKGANWKVGYHVAMMATELMRLKGIEFQSGTEILL
jgi:cellobiose epimerase